MHLLNTLTLVLISFLAASCSSNGHHGIKDGSNHWTTFERPSGR